MFTRIGTWIYHTFIWPPYWAMKKRSLLKNRARRKKRGELYNNPGKHRCWECQQYDIESHQCSVAMMTPRGPRYLFFALDDLCFWYKRKVTGISLDNERNELRTEIEDLKRRGEVE